MDNSASLGPVCSAQELPTSYVNKLITLMLQLLPRILLKYLDKIRDTQPTDGLHINLCLITHEITYEEPYGLR